MIIITCRFLTVDSKWLSIACQGLGLHPSVCYQGTPGYSAVTPHQGGGCFHAKKACEVYNSITTCNSFVMCFSDELLFLMYCKTHELFARSQDLALQKFLIRPSSTVFGRHTALLLSGPPMGFCSRVNVAVSNKKRAVCYYISLSACRHYSR